MGASYRTDQGGAAAGRSWRSLRRIAASGSNALFPFAVFLDGVIPNPSGRRKVAAAWGLRQARGGPYPAEDDIELQMTTFARLMTDDVDTRRRRALYRASHRGTKEMDHLVGGYARARLPGMDLPSIERFERFLELPDPLLQSWFYDAGAGAEDEYKVVIKDMRAFFGLAPPAEARD